MKTLYVCGDSFLTPSAIIPESHFTELISKKINYDLKVLAHGGMSNNGICLQIEMAIKNNASFIIVSPTYYDRIEIPIIDKESYYDANDLFYFGSTYANYSNNTEKGLVSDSIISLLSPDNKERFKKIKGLEEKIQSIKEYLTNIYSPIWKEQQDKWSLYAALHKLHISNIPYIMILDRLNITKECNWLTEKTSVLPFNDISQFVGYCLDYSKKNNINADPGYHTLPEHQIYIAENLLTHIDKFKMLD